MKPQDVDLMRRHGFHLAPASDALDLRRQLLAVHDALHPECRGLVDLAAEIGSLRSQAVDAEMRAEAAEEKAHQLMTRCAAAEQKARHHELLVIKMRRLLEQFGVKGVRL